MNRTHTYTHTGSLAFAHANACDRTPRTLARKPARHLSATVKQHGRTLLLGAALLLGGSQAHAAGYDIMGGATGAQTLHHCGWLPTQNVIYTNVPRNTSIIQRKLTNMGYYTGAVDGVNSPITKQAVAAFQRDYGLRVDGIVGIETSRAIGFAANNASWVRTCHRPYNTGNSRI